MSRHDKIPSGYGTSQKTKIQAFVATSAASISTAIRNLKVADWQLQAALDNYYNNLAPPPPNPITSTNLNRLFDKYREDSPSHTIAISGAISYMADLGVSLDEPVCLAVHTLLSSPTIGEFTRPDFISGWLSAANSASPPDSLPLQSAYISTLRRALPVDPTLFKRVYRHTFRLARQPGQTKSIPIDTAVEYWKLLFSGNNKAPSWRGPSGTDWLGWWIEFVETEWRRGVNSDMWNMLYEFQVKTMEPDGETMNWWSEDGAWPGVLDDFVVWIRDKRRKDEVVKCE